MCCAYVCCELTVRALCCVLCVVCAVMSYTWMCVGCVWVMCGLCCCHFLLSYFSLLSLSSLFADVASYYLAAAIAGTFYYSCCLLILLRIAAAAAAAAAVIVVVLFVLDVNCCLCVIFV